MNYKPIAILGNPDSGKTTLMLHLANTSGLEIKYLLGYPEPIKRFTMLNDMRDLARISDCVVCIDEIDEIIPIYDKRANASLKRLLKFAFHNRIKLIFNTQLSQFVSKMMAALVPQWAITELDIFELKNGSKPKRILLDYIKLPQTVNKEVGMRLAKGKYVWYNDYAKPGENGIKTFPNLNLRKAWGIQTKKERKQEVKSIQNSLINPERK